MKKNTVGYVRSKGIGAEQPNAPHIGSCSETQQETGVEMLKIIQINTDRVRAAQDLLLASAVTEKVYLVIVSEPNVNMVEKIGWIMDERKDAAIGIINKKIVIEWTKRGKGYVAAYINKIVMYSCYISPNCELREYEETLQNIGDDIKTRRGHILVAGDFNASSIEWGSKLNNRRGQILSEWAAENSLIIKNEGEVPTFERGEKKSRPGITLANETLARDVKYWRVDQNETHSGHKYICYNIGKTDPTTRQEKEEGWNVKKLATDKLRNYLRQTCNERKPETAEDLVEMVKKTYDNSMPKRIKNRRQVYWWNDEIASKRKEYMKKRREYTRNKMEENRKAYKEAKKSKTGYNGLQKI